VQQESIASTSFDFSVAVKADDAAIPTLIWDDRIWALGLHNQSLTDTFKLRFGRNALEAIRSGLLLFWR
jgi:hypothetical protein